MFTRDSLDQCLDRKKAYELIILVGVYGPNIENGKLDRNTLELLKDDLMEFFEELFEGEGPFDEEIE